MVITTIGLEKSIDVSATDYENKQGFFFRAEGTGTIYYIPFLAEGDDADTKIAVTVDSAQYSFSDCRMARKILSSGTDATSIYIGLPL